MQILTRDYLEYHPSVRQVGKDSVTGNLIAQNKNCVWYHWEDFLRHEITDCSISRCFDIT